MNIKFLIDDLFNEVDDSTSFIFIISLPILLNAILHSIES